MPEFGRTKEVADGIDGLELLEEHFKSMRKEANGGVSDDEELEIDENDEAGWDNWDVESEDDSDSDEWNDVSSDGEDFEISDSEDEDDKPKSKKARLSKKAEDDEDEDDDAKSVVSTATSTATEVRKISLLAQQKILTPADFALLNELKLKAAQNAVEQGGGSAAKRKLAALEASKRNVGEDEQNRFLTESEILGARKRTKQDYEERMESIRKGREGREKFGSLKGKKMKEAPSSSTNREKARNKPLMMAIQWVPSRWLLSFAANTFAARTRLCRRRRPRCATSRCVSVLPSRSRRSRSSSRVAPASVLFLHPCVSFL